MSKAEIKYFPIVVFKEGEEANMKEVCQEFIGMV